MVFKFKTTGRAKTRQNDYKFRNKANKLIHDQKEESIRWTWAAIQPQTCKVYEKEYDLIYPLPNRKPSVSNYKFNYLTRTYEKIINKAGVVEEAKAKKPGLQKFLNFVLYWDGKCWWVAHVRLVEKEKTNSNWQRFSRRAYFNEEEEHRWHKKNNFYFTRIEHARYTGDRDWYLMGVEAKNSKYFDWKCDYLDFTQWIYTDNELLQCTWHTDEYWYWLIED